jgi:hyperosmotically inducible protein
MRNWIGSLGLAVVLAGAGLAATGTTANVSDADLAKKITHEIRMYPYYSIWDDVNFRVEDGQVALLGEVSQPFKKADLGRIVQHVAGVRSLTNDLKVLPLSTMDDRLRLQVARAIYGDPSLSRYGAGTLPSIHIIVDNGRVTLEGVVTNKTDKDIAGVRASAAGLSFGPVVNNLRVEGPTKG